MSLLNLHEEVRSQPAAWVPVGFIPNYDAKLATHRKGTGFTSDASRKLDIFHQCFRLLLAELVGLEGTMDITWGDGITRTCTLNLGGLLGTSRKLIGSLASLESAIVAVSKELTSWRP